MALMAVAFPIAPGQSAQWHAWMEELRGPRRAEFVASRREAGVRERTFLQPTPMGELVIVTLEGDDPLASFAKMVSKDDAFTRWFIEHANAAHGMDLSTDAASAVDLGHRQRGRVDRASADDAHLATRDRVRIAGAWAASSAHRNHPTRRRSAIARCAGPNALGDAPRAAWPTAS